MIITVLDEAASEDESTLTAIFLSCTARCFACSSFFKRVALSILRSVSFECDRVRLLENLFSKEKRFNENNGDDATKSMRIPEVLPNGWV